MRGYIEINPLKEYNWMDLPQDAVVKKIKYNSDTERVEIHYKSKSGEIVSSCGKAGFEYNSVPNSGSNIKITMSMKGEIREIIYSKVVDCDGRKFLIVISKWKKE